MPRPHPQPRFPGWRRPLPLTRLARYAWAAPTTAVGLLFLVVAPVGGRIGTQVVDGVLELYGGLVTFFLRRCTLLEGGASAMTLGHVVLGRDSDALDWSRDHERVHVRQCERWGPLFLPAYVLASLFLWLSGRRHYEDNPFEREAYGTADVTQIRQARQGPRRRKPVVPRLPPR